MNKRAIVILVLASCGGSNKGSGLSNTGDTVGQMGAKKGCPLSAAADVQDRFPVGSIPDYRVNGLGEAAKCHDVFVPSDVIKTEGNSFRIVKEGVFEGHCPGEPDNRDKFQAYAPGSVAIEVNALGSSEGELGLGKPITLMAADTDAHAGVIAHIADSCGSQLTLGVDENATEWSLGPGCDKVAKVVPYDSDKTKLTQQQIMAVGAGSCTITAKLLGVEGTVLVTVK